MIDIKLLRLNSEIFYKSCRDRGFDTRILDEFFELDNEWKENLKQLNNIKHDKNSITMEISRRIKSGDDINDLKLKVESLNIDIQRLEGRQNEIDVKRNEILRLIPNLLADDVPRCFGDENNRLVRYYGRARVFSDDVKYFIENSGSGDYEEIDYRPKSHVDLISELNLADIERAGKIAGARFYFLKNRLFKLELALINYAVDFLSQRGYTVLEPPFMINYKSMSGATDIETFKDTLYKIEGDDLYLIATAEHPIASMLQDEILMEDELPIRVSGVSPCFRREAGAHGKDTKGIFRVHQFNKIEQFVFCKPEDSWDFFDELVRNSEDIYKSLKIPYRVVNVCSGELGNLAAKKYDIEAWFPAQGKFREIVSASNDTDYQARSLNIKYRSRDGNRFVHTLNSTAIATERILVAIMENFQDRNGKVIKIPEVLIPYTGFSEIGGDDN
ncbi:serine--tRNA ligase [Picrophilus oshimae]|uniref:Serine--tRNA ligase n=1 Tax=Picrophilus torridus (strain ATCC 700027 / DSM 9790 / JCM 10055 / NBRC 100828 / KAW 2/3) TaxID=1122961 RepID=SYS_PICTO|nr:serine--tRNA ligase [Picrophilus oshimae]Q6KZN5.1 RecName: Full=Serine--tRNA ligase; AltName: Full=Seryl-tRNA synthetase; Short=SerRS; AltName: Full=Seryl-tRNA(Ser/Sec) synthetase [Picrophilus oshimae DSM 9789]AAT43817.1 seryl-tRNA synthetase [Picrophilus oshimae DSM 9789]